MDLLTKLIICCSDRLPNSLVFSIRPPSRLPSAPCALVCVCVCGCALCRLLTGKLFQIDISEDEAQKMTSVQDAVTYISENL